MRVRLRLYATLRDYLPAGTDTAGALLDLAGQATVADALAALAVPPALAHIVMINGRHVPRGEAAGRRLAEGDELAVFPAIGGG